MYLSDMLMKQETIGQIVTKYKETWKIKTKKKC